MPRCFIVRRLAVASDVPRWRCWVLLALAACAQVERTPPDASGSGGAAGGAGAATLSEAAWQALTGPRPGEHDVYSSACGEQPIGQDYRIMPPIACIERRDEDGRSTLVRDCALADYCTTTTDCTAQARGVCTGSMNSVTRQPTSARATSIASA